jgi:hypothetical protein
LISLCFPSRYIGYHLCRQPVNRQTRNSALPARQGAHLPVHHPRSPRTVSVTSGGHAPRRPGCARVAAGEAPRSGCGKVPTAWTAGRKKGHSSARALRGLACVVPMRTVFMQAWFLTGRDARRVSGSARNGKPPLRRIRMNFPSGRRRGCCFSTPMQGCVHPGGWLPDQPGRNPHPADGR